MLKITYSIFCVLAVLVIAVLLNSWMNPFMHGAALIGLLPLYGVLLFACSELVYWFTPLKRKGFYLEDYLKKTAWFAIYSLFVAICIIGAYAITGVMLTAWFFIVIGFFVFRFIRLVQPHDAGEYL